MSRGVIALMLLVCLVLRMMQFLGVIGISVRLTCSVDRLS
eukprot:gene13140-8986_t